MGLKPVWGGGDASSFRQFRILMLFLAFSGALFAQEGLPDGYKSYAPPGNTSVPQPAPAPPFTNSGIPYVGGTKSTVCTDRTQTKFVRINYHFIMRGNGTGNFNETGDGLGNAYNGYQRAEDIVKWANLELGVLAPVWRTNPLIPSQGPAKIQYVLSGVYFHRSDATYRIPYYDFSPLNSLLINEGTEINIFDNQVYNHTTNGNVSGVANQRTEPQSQRTRPLIAMVNLYNEYVNPLQRGWIQYAAQTLNHEIGHLIGLDHAWLQDGCPDSPEGVVVNLVNRQCWKYVPNDPICGNWANLSNNLMDYNQWFPHALTPCQLNKVHNTLETVNQDYVERCESCTQTAVNFGFGTAGCWEYIPIVLSGSDPHEWYKIDIAEVDGSGAEIWGTTFTTNWTWGSLTWLDLATIYRNYYSPNSNAFLPGRKYKISVMLDKSDCHNYGKQVSYYNTGSKLIDCTLTPEEGGDTPMFPSGLSVNAWPNPTGGASTFQVDYELVDASNIDIQITNTLGIPQIEVLGTQKQDKGSHSITVDISKLSKGTYFLVVRKDGKSTSRPIFNF